MEECVGGESVAFLLLQGTKRSLDRGFIMFWLILFFMLCTIISVALWRVAICAYDRELQVKISNFFIGLFMVLSIVCVIIMFFDIKIPVNASE